MFDKKVTEWKFSVLDSDKSGNLTKIEYKDLRKLVRKVVRPKRCARAFIRICDTDRNNVLSKTEWTKCLSLSGEQLITVINCLIIIYNKNIM